MKKIFTIMSVLAVTVVMAGCSHKAKHTESGQSKTAEYYQTHTDADVTRAHVKMYTGANKTRMGDIKFHETNSGLEMAVDLKKMQPDTEYTIAVFKTKCDKDGKKCTMGDRVATNLPKLKAGPSGELKEDFVLHGITAMELTHHKIVLQRAGNDKAAWGSVEKGMMLF